MPLTVPANTQGKPSDRLSQTKSGLEAYWSADQGGAGKPPGGDQPSWGGGGQPDEPDDQAYGVGDLRKFLKEWGEYGFTISCFFLAYQVRWQALYLLRSFKMSPPSYV